MKLLNIFLMAPLPGGGNSFSFLPIIVCAIIIFAIIGAIISNQNNEETTNADQTNKISRVTLVGGMIGLFVGSPLGSLNKKIKDENAKGWEVVQIIPDTNLNLMMLIGRILLLIVTLFIYTTSNGYYIVLKRKV